MTGRNQGRPSARDPNVPAEVARLAAMLTKAELTELLWHAWQASDSKRQNLTPHWALVWLIVEINRRRRAADPYCTTLDASRMSGAGIDGLRQAIADAMGEQAQIDAWSPTAPGKP